MKNDFYYLNLNPIINLIALKCYDAICKRIAKTYPNSDMFFRREYRWYVQHNEIKPGNISRFILTPYWHVIGDMLATKILIKILKM